MDGVDAYVASAFDARRHVHRVLQAACVGSEEDAGRTIRSWERDLHALREAAERRREACYHDLRGRLPRAIREAKRMAETASAHASRAKGTKGDVDVDVEEDPARALRRAANRMARAERVARTLDAVRMLHEEEEDEEDEGEEGDGDVARWCRDGRRAQALRRALRATEDVRGYEEARGGASRRVRAWLLRGQRLAERAAAVDRAEDVRRLLRVAKRCGDASAVRGSAVRVLGARMARFVVQACDDGREEEGGGGGAHARAWLAWGRTCAEERAAWDDPTWWSDAAAHAWDEATRARPELSRPVPSDAPRDRMRGERDALVDALRVVLGNQGIRPETRAAGTTAQGEGSEEEEEEEGEGTEEGGTDAVALAWKVSSPWRRTAVAWRATARARAFEGTGGGEGGEGRTEDLRASTRRMEDRWTRWATAWWGDAKERCACATDLADAEGLARLARRSACELAARQAELAEAWTDRRPDGRRNAREDAADLLRMAVCACACACDVRRKCARVLASAPVLDGDAALVGEDGTLDLARLWRRAAAEETDGAIPLDADDPPTEGDAERHLADALRATEAAFVATAARAAVARLVDACAVPYLGRDERGRDEPDASRDPRGGVGKGTRGGPDVSWPTFSASPQECVASAGEDLLRVPERIVEVDACVRHHREVKAILRAASEGAEEEDDEDDGEEMDEAERKLLPWLAEATVGIDPTARVDEGEGGILVASWSARVAEHAAQKYAEALLQGIRRLDAEGEAQLQADLEYFLNVIAALAAEAPSSLVTLRDCASMEPERLQELAQTTPASNDDHGTPFDRDAVRVLLRAKERGLSSGP